MIVTVFTKSGGALTKTIALDPTGKVRSDADGCLMAQGEARRLKLNDIVALGEAIERFEPRHALGLGALRPDLPDQVKIVSQAKLNGAADTIARTADNLIFDPGKPSLALFDHDTKGMPAEVAARIVGLGGFEPALLSLLPQLSGAAWLFRASTSAGLYRADTGEKLAGSGGMHGYAAVRDGADVGRLLEALHDRAWLAGLGWYLIGAAGQLLERSIVDRTVGSPERLVFEGPPVLVAPLAQDAAGRRPVVHDGAALDTVAACPPLTVVERSKLAEARAKAAHALREEASKVRFAFVTAQAERLAQRTGSTVAAARRIVEKQCRQVLLPDVELQFDHLEPVTVATVLADPDRYIGETLADPIEGLDYGRGKAKVLRRDDGSLLVHSFAHGGAGYALRRDHAAAEAMLEQASGAELVDLFVELALNAELSPGEVEKLRNLVAKRTGTGRRQLEATLKAARAEQARQRRAETTARQAAERRDPRPQFGAPVGDAEYLPVVEAVTEVFRASTDGEPPMRDPEGYAVAVWRRRVARLRSLAPAGQGETPLPSPEMALITRLDEPAMAELVERHVEYVAQDRDGTRSVHLAPHFVKHLVQRQDDGLPVVTAVATLPVVLDDGTILAVNGLAREHGTMFRVPGELLAMLPRREACTPDAVAAAMRWLVEEWLVDVSAGYVGKCTLTACALTIVERVLLAERPAFLVTAGKAKGGKTTALNMMALAVLGHRAAATAWSSREEERRKALFSYLLEGVPFLVWDNIANGSQLACPHVEKALTAETYGDRILGVSRSAAPLASMVQGFTGNNIGAKGDLASRTLTVRLPITRPDPENRNFTHRDIFGWTLAHRGQILAALYTILLGNPRRGLRTEERDPAPTRFKTWWELVGSAVEHAAAQDARVADERSLIADPPACPPEAVSFAALFGEAEAEDEQAVGLVQVLDKLAERWPRGEWFDAAAVAKIAEEDGKFRGALEQASGRAIMDLGVRVVTWRLRSLRDNPVALGGKVVALRYRATSDDRHTGTLFRVEEVTDA